LTLDNSQKKIPLNFPNIEVKKSYNCSTDKEDIHINGKLASQRDLANLLESAGFSPFTDQPSSLSYQIVEQGKI